MSVRPFIRTYECISVSKFPIPPPKGLEGLGELLEGFRVPQTAIGNLRGPKKGSGGVGGLDLRGKTGCVEFGNFVLCQIIK